MTLHWSSTFREFYFPRQTLTDKFLDFVIFINTYTVRAIFCIVTLQSFNINSYYFHNHSFRRQPKILVLDDY